MSQNSKIAREVSSKSSKKLNTKQNNTVHNQTKKKKKHRPKYILCLIKLCEMGNVLKPEFDQYT